MTQPQITLYCLPFAGGNSYSYRIFKKHLPEFINLKPIELPGRGKRIKEPLLTNLDLMTEDVLRTLQDDGLTQPYAIFGHSMGAYLGYLVTQRLTQANLPLPLHLIVSGHHAPSVPTTEFKYQLSKSQFVAKLRELEGCPPEILEHAELIDFFEPLLRADFQAVETWSYRPQSPLTLPLTVLRGIQDQEANYTEVLAWQRECVQPLVLKEFPGGHFFIFEQVQEVCQLISQILTANGLKV